jgi:hypothetical protein
MAKTAISTKRLAISKANAQTVIVLSIASFVTVFCLVAAKAVWGQTRYQARVTTAATKANKQLQTNIQAFGNLATAYNAFNASPLNIIGGSSTGSGGQDGNNAKIILDALPNTYDFPALTSSLEKILVGGGYSVSNISGSDEQLSQQANLASPTPQAVSMAFSFTVNQASYASIQQLVSTLQASIRPIVIDSMTLNGAANSMTLTVNAHTYYQPGKSLTITKQVIK